MVAIGVRYKQTLTQIVQHISEAEITPFTSDKPFGICYYQNSCDVSEKKLVRVTFSTSGRERSYVFHLTCYQRLLAPLQN